MLAHLKIAPAGWHGCYVFTTLQESSHKSHLTSHYIMDRILHKSYHKYFSFAGASSWLWQLLLHCVVSQVSEKQRGWGVKSWFNHLKYKKPLFWKLRNLREKGEEKYICNCVQPPYLQHQSDFFLNSLLILGPRFNLENWEFADICLNIIRICFSVASEEQERVYVYRHHTGVSKVTLSCHYHQLSSIQGK